MTVTTIDTRRIVIGPLTRLLARIGIYERLKVSWVYELFWRIVDARIVRDAHREVDFYRRTLHGLRKGDVIFDIGANQGHKTFVFLRLGARVVAVDPDETNQEIVRQRFLKYRVSPCPVSLVPKAVSDASGVATLWVDAPGSAKNTMCMKWVETLRDDEHRFGERLTFSDARRIQTVTVDELIATYGEPFFIKIDVEGHEPSVLRGLRQPVPYVSFEVNLPEFAPEGETCLDLLRAVDPDGEFNYVTDVTAGLVLERWVPHQTFTHLFHDIHDSSIEVFWRSRAAVANRRTAAGVPRP